MSKEVSRYRDIGETIYGQMQEILVECPQCRSCATITCRPDAQPHPVSYFTPRRLVCRDCGFIKEQRLALKKQESREIGFDWYSDPMRDSYFGLPLWLQTRCCNHVLWAHNRHHLYVIEQYVQARLREHRPDPRFGWHNSSLVNRLPEWIIAAKHRRAVLSAIAKLKQPR